MSTQTTITSVLEANKKKAITIAMVVGIITGGLLAVWTVFSTPADVRASQARMQEIVQQSELLQAQVVQAKVEWAAVDDEHQQLLQQIALLENEKRSISERAEQWRQEYDHLQTERVSVAMEIAGFPVGR